MPPWSAKVLRTAFAPKQFPDSALPEIAFAGRSNVGKSSLINGLVGQRLAHTSSKPGKTRSINFFEVAASRRFVLVDLPGFGYAARSKIERGAWASLIEGYIASRRQLALVVHLVDFRHGPLANDRMLQQWLTALQVPLQVVFTKVDKISRGKRRALTLQYLREGLYSWGAPVLCSIEEENTIEALKDHLDRFLSERPVH